MRLRPLALAILVAAPLIAALTAFTLPNSGLRASAAPTTGSITGQVVWNAPIPVPYGAAPGAVAPDQSGQATPDGTSGTGSGEAAPGTETTPSAPSDTAPQAVPVPPSGRGGIPIPVPIRPPQPRLIPAGAVLVAIQGTSLNARTDAQGRFRIDGVPTGQYLTIAAGPVDGVTTAYALRPNVVLPDSGGTVDLGRLSLGMQYQYYGPVPYGGATAPDASQ